MEQLSPKFIKAFAMLFKLKGLIMCVGKDFLAHKKFGRLEKSIIKTQEENNNTHKIHANS